MRNLAVLGTRKIGRMPDAHRRVLKTLATATGEVARMHSAPAAARERTVQVLIGSERGFCGDLNEALLRAWQKMASTARRHCSLSAAGSQRSRSWPT